MRPALVKRILYLLLTALLILGGAAMPFLTVGVQDAYTEERTERRPFEAVQLSLRQELEVGQVLRLLSGTAGSDGWNNSYLGGTTWIDWQSDTRLTREGVEKTVTALVQQMIEEDMMRCPAGEWTLHFYGMDPNLVVSDSIRDLSAVIWVANYELVPAEDGEVSAAYVDKHVGGSMCIDDATGYMVGMVLPVSNYWKKLSLSDRTGLMADFLQRYYGMELLVVETETSHEYAPNPEDEFGSYRLRFDMGEIGQCDVPLIQDGTWLYFNN